MLVVMLEILQRKTFTVICASTRQVSIINVERSGQIEVGLDELASQFGLIDHHLSRLQRNRAMFGELSHN